MRTGLWRRARFARRQLYSLPFLARCSLRGSINPSYYFVYVGFRCVRRV